MSLLRKVRLSAPATKKVVLLPDHAFFVRVVPLPPETPAAAVPAQVELVLEGLSPFPVAHLCYGYFHRAGSGRVLVYAAYRRRFTVDDASRWAGADAVLPAFAAWLGASTGGPLALLIQGSDFITALGWDGADAVPSVIVTRQVSPEEPAGERAAAQTAVAAALRGLPPPVEVAPPAGLRSRVGDDGLEYAEGRLISRFGPEELDALDVRDKAELAQRRRERMRDVYLWRIFQGCAAGLLLAAVLELGLKGGHLWLQTRAAIAAAQAPAVQNIETKNSLANRIEELSTRRLLPMEMISLVGGTKLKGNNIQFLRTATKGLNVLEIEGQTNSAPDVFNYQAALKGLPACESVELGQTTERSGTTRFILTVTFKADTLRPAGDSS